MQDGMLIIEAKDMAADKMSDADKIDDHNKSKKKDDDNNVDGDLLVLLGDLLDGWDDKKHEYYKDLLKVYESHGGEIEEEEVEEEYE